MADKNNDLYELSKSDLIDKVISLKEDNNELKCAKESDVQRIYELRRQLETSKAAQAYLMQELELESRNAAVNNMDSESTKKLKAELEEWRKKYNTMKVDFESLQADQEAHLKQIDELKDNLKEISKKEVAVAPNNEAEELKSRVQLLEEEYMALLQKMDELQSRDMANIFALGAKDREIEILKDQILSLEENLKSKKEDLEEKIQVLETTQDQLSDANSKIALLSASANDKTNTKGNSLFAEVDDQRQAMKQLLNVQKKRFLEMKKKYNESDYEIRRLRREKNAIHAELDMWGKILTKSRQDFYDNLVTRIRQLQSHNERLEEQLKWTQDNLKKDAGQNVPWIDSMFNFCKEETNELKVELRKIRMDKASLDEAVRNLQHESVRYRFENLRLRLSISEYENILNDNKIPFTPPNMNDISKKVSEMSEQQKMDLLEKYRVVDNENQKEDTIITSTNDDKLKITINETATKVEDSFPEKDHAIISFTSNDDKLENKINEAATEVENSGPKKDDTIISFTSNDDKLENKINETTTKVDNSGPKKQHELSSTPNVDILESTINETTTKVENSGPKKQHELSSTPNVGTLESKINETAIKVDYSWPKKDHELSSTLNVDTLEAKINETATKLEMIKIKDENKLDLMQDNVKIKEEKALIINDKENISNGTNIVIEASSLDNGSDINTNGLSSILKTSHSNILSSGSKKVQFTSPRPSEKFKSENKMEGKYSSPTMHSGNGEEESKTATIGKNKTNVKILRMKIKSAQDNSKS